MERTTIKDTLESGFLYNLTPKGNWKKKELMAMIQTIYTTLSKERL